MCAAGVRPNSVTNINWHSSVACMILLCCRLPAAACPMMMMAQLMLASVSFLRMAVFKWMDGWMWKFNWCWCCCCWPPRTITPCITRVCAWHARMSPHHITRSIQHRFWGTHHTHTPTTHKEACSVVGSRWGRKRKRMSATQKESKL